MRELQRFPELYKKSTSNGKISVWKIWVEGSTIHTESGYIGQKMKSSKDTVAKGKNIGRSNETTPHEQAVSEAKSKHQKYQDKGYHSDLKAVEKGKASAALHVPRPMLAHDFSKHSHKMAYPLAIQPKLDGCLVGSTYIDTDRGKVHLSKIIRSSEPYLIKSWNESLNKVEYRPLLNRFDNGEGRPEDFLTIKVGKKKSITCTKNHKIYTNNGWKQAGDLDPSKDMVWLDNPPSRESVLLGTLLGDSGIVWDTRRSLSTRLAFTHSEKDSEYFNFKRELFQHNGKVGHATSGHGSKMLRSSATVDISPAIKTLYYTSGSKIGARKTLVRHKDLRKLFTWDSLALWIGDDGSLAHNNGNPLTPILTLHTQGYSEDQVAEFEKLFRSSFGLDPYRGIDKKVKDGAGIFLTFNTKDSLYIFNMLKDKVPRGVERKFYFVEGAMKPIHGGMWAAFKITRPNRSIFHKYDIEVEGNHNYFADGVLVHNCRAVFMGGRFYSRNGKALAHLPDLASDVEAIFGKDVVVDGEIYSDGLKDNFEEIMSAAKKVKGPNPKAHLLQYHVYDIVEEGLSYEARFHKIRAAFKAYKKCGVKQVETLTVHNENEVKAAHRLFLDKGYEGSMLRQPGSTYEIDKRSYGLQKYKPIDDSEFRIVGIKEGRGSLAGSAVFILEIDDEHGKRTFDAVMTGTGAREFMKKCFTNHKLWKGKWMQVHYFGLTNKEKVPRFPRGKKIRDVE